MARAAPLPGWRFDPFADVRLGKSLFEMSPDDWLAPETGTPAVAPADVSQPPAPETAHVR